MTTTRRVVGTHGGEAQKLAFGGACLRNEEPLACWRDEKFQMKMVLCLNTECNALWPVPDLAVCENCAGKMLQKVDVPSSLELVFDAYAELPTGVTGPRPKVVRSTDVYPLILEELALVLEGQVAFLLYGSAALWLEGKSRPDKSEFQSIKDLDMCAWTNEGIKNTEALLRELIKNTIVGKFIVWEKEYVFLSNGNTLEFMSRDHLIQFSFALKGSLEEFRAIHNLGALVVLPTRRKSQLRCAGLSFISEGLLAEKGLFRTTLFRSDKTEKLLIYACLCLGYKTVKVQDVLRCLVVNLAGAQWAEKKGYVTNVGMDRNTGPTKYFHHTKDMVLKLDQIRSFRARQEKTTYNQVIEASLMEILGYIARSRPSKEQREKRTQELYAEALLKEGITDPKSIAKNRHIALMQEIGKKVTDEFDIASYNKALELTIEDAVAIWESEVGTGMLIFLTEQLHVVQPTITQCCWIEEEHRQIILNGYGTLLEVMLQTLEDRLDNQSARAVKPDPKVVAKKPSSEVVVKKPPVSTLSLPSPQLTLNVNLNPRPSPQLTSVSSSADLNPRPVLVQRPPPPDFRSLQVVQRYVLWNTTGTIISHLQRAYGPEALVPYDSVELGLGQDPNSNPPHPEHKGHWNEAVVRVIMTLIVKLGVPADSGLEHYLKYEARSL